MPKIGDLIIQNDKYYGLVRDIEIDKWGHQRCVRIEWSGVTPRDYNPDYGYAGVNIHNCRNDFRVFRDGEEIR